ncbi:uncharacterized protein LOC111902678 [Lactuca sativa]|uniref:DUF4378 domain-containing protein n=1 Tax=Lactuca sativa TaxID=4236 RepID=A0A9R1X0Q3_LACSA|nr:uncharacterized protein LOC111902678 [Lactuca sativa]KAJ0196225.1 hypothetical protein LSAT_V11C700344260 [Lactuca sativa]
MAKRSKQRGGRQKKEQSGCMWGLISMFDFRHGRATKRLLSDRKRYTPTNATHDSPYLTSEVSLPTNSEELHQSIEKPGFDLMRTRVKELIKEEMFMDQDSKKQNDINKLENHKPKHTEKILKESHDQEISITHQVSPQKTSHYQDLEALVKEILLIYQKKNEQNDDPDTGAKRSFPIVEEKLVAAIETLLNENGGHKKFHHSREMFQMLSSNKEMFFKLIQDQNSILLNEDQKSKSKSKSKVISGPKFPETELTDRETEEPVTHKHRKFFRRRSKSVDNIPMNEKGKIVILKPGSPENQIGNENSSQFSFMEIKRRLKNAMGKEQRTLGKTIDGHGGWSSPNRNHFYTERFATATNFHSWRSKDDLAHGRVSKLRESEMNEEDTNHRISNIYVEAKKHLSEMLTSGDEDADLMMRSLPKSLGRILSLREYNSLSPGTSPRAQDFRLVNKSQLSTDNDNHEENITSEGVEVIVESESCDKEHEEEQTEGVDVLSESHGLLNGVEDNHIAVIPDSSNEESSSDSLKQDLPDENDSSSCGPHINIIEATVVASKTEEREITPSDKAGKPSPISVLDPLFSDDDISPARTVSRPVEPAIQPLRIQFDEEPVSRSEDQQIRITNSEDSEESAFEYIEAVLLSSDLNWADFEKRWLSGTQILDPSIFEEVETFSGRAQYDQRLLFDSTNEVLEEVCDHFIPESLFIKKAVWPVPKGMDLINEVWRRIESRLCKVYPRDLDKLVRNELGTSKMWLDLDNFRSESREIVVKIEESIFEETMDDTLLSLFDTTNHGLSCS